MTNVEAERPPGWMSSFLRQFIIQGSWNYRSMLGSGFAYCMIPLLRRRGLSGHELDDAVRSHMGPFNSHPYLAGLALGAVARMEDSGMDAETIERFKRAIQGSLGGLGDLLIWGAWRPATLLLALVLAWAGAPPWVPVCVCRIVYNLGHVALRWWGYSRGRQYGKDVGVRLRGAERARRGERGGAGGARRRGSGGGAGRGVAVAARVGATVGTGVSAGRDVEVGAAVGDAVGAAVAAGGGFGVAVGAGVEVAAGCATCAEVSGATGGGASPPQADSVKTSKTTRIKIPYGPVLFPLVISSFHNPIEAHGGLLRAVLSGVGARGKSMWASSRCQFRPNRAELNSSLRPLPFSGNHGHCRTR